jgi:hypothetical protein
MLPSPDAVIAMFSGTVVSITAAELTVPTDSANVITIPAVTGVTYYVDDVEHAAGALAAMTSGQSHVVSARVNTGYVFVPPIVTEWYFAFA